ncbi:MAG: GIY-YIG nuclease family protein [Dehalococcoidia bacterium]|nr:GIY-YIG nuclease family protein [Dehalococcoidia bacterium]
MPGRGYHGGFGGRRSFGGRSRTGGRSSGRSRSRSRSARRAGSSRSSARGVVAYSIYNSSGKRTYIGSTNNPERRAAEHTRDGRLTRGGELVVESRPMSREAAQRLEAKKIQGYRRRTGKLPRLNRTSDGQHHHRGRG